MAGCEPCSSRRKGNEIYKNNTNKRVNKIFRNVSFNWGGKAKKNLALQMHNL